MADEPKILHANKVKILKNGKALGYMQNFSVNLTNGADYARGIGTAEPLEINENANSYICNASAFVLKPGLGDSIMNTFPASKSPLFPFDVEFVPNGLSTMFVVKGIKPADETFNTAMNQRINKSMRLLAMGVDPKNASGGGGRAQAQQTAV